MTAHEREAVRHAITGAESWRLAVHAQRTAEPDHSDWYAITGELVDTLRCLASVVTAIGHQVAGYGEGRVVHDDDPTVEPTGRLADTVRRTEWLRAHLDIAERSANDLWSLISHIAVEVDQ